MNLALLFQHEDFSRSSNGIRQNVPAFALGQFSLLDQEHYQRAHLDKQERRFLEPLYPHTARDARPRHDPRTTRERLCPIRAYAAFSGLVAAAVALMPLLIGSLAWVILRAIVGFGCAGIFVTTESWLTAKALPSERGRVFSIYMVGTFLALALGQLLIARTDIKTAASFNVIVALFAVALIMVTAARAEPPRVGGAAAVLPYGVLARAAPIAVTGCALSGLVGGAFYALVPAWMQDQGTPRATIALFMLVAVLGGFAFQIPVGRLSDRVDRRMVVALLGLGFACTALVMVLLPRSLLTILPPAVLLGGF